ncbi:MAG: DUF7020 family protein [Bacteroidales bacterium]
MKNRYRALVDNAPSVLKKAIMTRDLKKALMVFKNLAFILPGSTSLPDENRMPLVLRRLHNRHMERYQTYYYVDIFHQEMMYFMGDYTDKQRQQFISEGFDPKKAEELLWEILKNGEYAFEWDW